MSAVRVVDGHKEAMDTTSTSSLRVTGKSGSQSRPSDSVQSESRLASPERPGVQGVHAVPSVAAYRPGLQSVHTVCPVNAANIPAAHISHSAPALCWRARPAAHRSHAVLAGAELKNPGMHSKHSVRQAAAAAERPTAQGSQASSSDVLPLLPDVLARRPALHSVQALCPSAEKRPNPHSVHALFPAASVNLPLAQSAQA